MRGDAFRLLLLLLIAAAVAPAPLGGAAQSELGSWTRQDGQWLADACTRFGERNADTTVQLPASTVVELRNATFTHANSSSVPGLRPYSNGTLLWLGSGASSSVVDTVMRAGIIPTLFTARVVFADVSVTNLCWAAQSAEDFAVHSPIIMGIFSSTMASWAVFDNRTAVYLPQSSLASMTYAQTVKRTGLHSVRDGYRRRLATYAPLLGVFSASALADEVLLTSTAGGAPSSRVWRSTSKREDPLMAFMRREGTLMEPRWCTNGTLVPRELAHTPVDREWGPLWMVDGEREMEVALRGAAELAPVQAAAQLPVPGVMFFTPHVPAHALPSLPLGAPLLLHGPLNDALPPPLLDLTARTSALFTVDADGGGNGLVAVGDMVLSAPALTKLSDGLFHDGHGTTTSALPLAALAAPSGSITTANRTLIELHNVTLVVPALDFLALLTLATDGGASSVRRHMDMATQQHAAMLQQGMQTLQLESLTPCCSFTLGAYTGWGVNASLLTLQPQTPLPDAVVQRLRQPPAGASAAPSSDGSTSGLSAGQLAGIVVGCVAGVVLLAGLVLAAVALSRSRSRHGLVDSASATSGSKAPPPAGGLPSKAVVLELRDSTDSAASAPIDDPKAALPFPVDLEDLLDGHEMRLLKQVHARNGTCEALVGSGTSAGTAAAVTPPPPPLQSLSRVHAQLMSLVLAQRQPQQATQALDAADVPAPGAARVRDAQGAALEEAGAALHPWVHVQQVAARLQRQGNDANTVVLQELLGRGGSGVVFAGTWRGLPVAVKTMVFEAWCGGDDGGGAHDSPAALTRLRYVHAVMETAISASVGHPNVVATYHHDIKRMDDSVMASGQGGLQIIGGDASMPDAAPSTGMRAFKVFLIQELCTCSLRGVLDQGVIQYTPKNTGTIINLLHQIALGLEYLHGKGIIHGDLTPGNVLLKLDRGSVRSVQVKLADFGLSQRLDPHATHVSNFAAGTPFYVAPEVSRHKRTSPASDIFSFGVVAWEVYAGEAPFTFDPQGAIKRNPLFPMYPAHRAPPPAVGDLIDRCMSVEPRMRPHASEVLDILGRHSPST